jgi:uncharacterized protein YeaO (DUF488 family)
MHGVGQPNNNGLWHAQIDQNAVNDMAVTTAVPPVMDAAAGAAAATPAMDFAQLGATFNDATRALVGGLWQTAVEEAGQGLGSVHRYTADLQSVQQGLQAEVNAGQFTGDTLTHVQTILQDLSTASAAATASVNGGAGFGSVATAEKALHDAHLDVLNLVNADPTLQALATQNGGQGFLGAPPALADGVTPKNAPHADLAQIGAIFDDFVNKSLGGINASNQQTLAHEARVLTSDLKQLIHDHPDQFQGLTAVHAETVVRQLELEQHYVQDAANNPVAGRGSNDNLLDIIDIVQGDANLAQMANDGTVSGFTPLGDALNPTPKYLDNQAQTNFWANFIADSNSLGDQAVQAVSQGGNHGGLIRALLNFEHQATQFDASQSGIFEARFDNELLGKTSTLGAEVTKMIEGLRTGNVALVQAAADEMHANAADVGGNNLPIGGGTYNTDGRTVADVLSAGAQVANAAGIGTGAGGQSGQQQTAQNAGADAQGAHHASTIADVLAGAAHIAATTPAATQQTPAAQTANQLQPSHTVAVDVHTVQPVDTHGHHEFSFAHLWG